MRRRGIGRGRPGLVGTMARTAVVAGTASAVVGASANKQQAAATQSAELNQLRAQAADAEMNARVDAAVAQQVAAAAPAAPATPAASGASVIDQLKELASLKEMGVLSDDEFTAAKAKLLGS